MFWHLRTENIDFICKGTINHFKLVGWTDLPLTFVSSQVQSHIQMGKLLQEKAWETERKTIDAMWDLLGLKHRESRSHRLDKVAHTLMDREGTTYVGEETKTRCVPGQETETMFLPKRARDLWLYCVLCYKESFLHNESPRKKTFTEGTVSQ